MSAVPFVTFVTSATKAEFAAKVTEPAITSCEDVSAPLTSKPPVVELMVMGFAT